MRRSRNKIWNGVEKKVSLIFLFGILNCLAPTNVLQMSILGEGKPSGLIWLSWRRRDKHEKRRDKGWDCSGPLLLLLFHNLVLRKLAEESFVLGWQRRVQWRVVRTGGPRWQQLSWTPALVQPGRTSFPTTAWSSSSSWTASPSPSLPSPPQSSL